MKPVKPYCLIFLLVIITSCTNSFKLISRKIHKRQSIGKSNLTNLSFHDVRLKLLSQKKLGFLNKSDTVLFFETFNIEEATFYGKIISSNDSIEYMYRNNEFKYNIHGPFTNIMSQLIMRWDTLEIKKNENLYSISNPSQWIYGTKISNYGANPTIATIKFQRFFKLGRD